MFSVGLLFLVWTCLLSFFRWSQQTIGTLGVLTSFVAGLLLFLGWVMLAMWAIPNQRAQQAQAPAQENNPFRGRGAPLFAAWTLFSGVIGYALLLLTLNGQLSAFLTTYLSYQPPFGPFPFWLLGLCSGLVCGYMFIIHVPAPLRVRPRRQRFLFLLARKTFGGAALGYSILWSFELSHRLLEGETDLFLELLATLAGIAGLTYLAAWAVVWLIRRREARQHEA